MKYINVVRKYGSRVAVAGSALLAGAAFAVDDTAITSAVDAGQASYGLVVAGVLGLVAIGSGLGYIIRWLSR